MAKKAVATFAAKAPKTGAYVFTEQLVETAQAKDFFNKK